MTDTTITPSKGFSRWLASGIHLLISIVIAALVMALLLKLWYPPPLFTTEGGYDLLLILVAVDVVIGPLITLIIFKSGKPELRFDLTMIALLQAGALAYGCYAMFVARPVFIVLAFGQFEIVRANDLDAADLAEAKDARFRSSPLTGPEYVAVDTPPDIKLQRKMVLQAREKGKSVVNLPSLYAPYADHKKQALAQSQPVDDLRKTYADIAAQAEKQIVEMGRKVSDVNFLLLQTRRGFGAVLIDAKTGDPIQMVPPPRL